MKKKLILGFVAALFAAVTVVNTNLAMKVYNGDATLESIAVMAQASKEGETIIRGGGSPNSNYKHSTTFGNNYNYGGNVPGFDEFDRPCKIEYGGGSSWGASAGADYNLTTNTIGVGWNASYSSQNPNSSQIGRMLECVFAWATCSSTECI